MNYFFNKTFLLVTLIVAAIGLLGFATAVKSGDLDPHREAVLKNTGWWAMSAAHLETQIQACGRSAPSAYNSLDVRKSHILAPLQQMIFANEKLVATVMTQYDAGLELAQGLQNAAESELTCKGWMFTVLEQQYSEASTEYVDAYVKSLKVFCAENPGRTVRNHFDYKFTCDKK